MSVSIHWKLMFRVSDRRALDKCLARVLPLLGAGVEVGECKPYWKFPELLSPDRQELGVRLVRPRVTFGR